MNKIRIFFGGIGDWMNRMAQKKWCNSLTVTLIVSIIITLLNEILARHSLISALSFMFTSPLAFIVNASLIFATLSIACMFRRRTFLFCLISFAWLSLGIINGVILLKRMTPFTVYDLAVLEDGLSIVPTYMSTAEIVFLVAAVVAIVAFFVLLFLKGPKKKTELKFKRNLVAVLLIAALTLGIWNGATYVGIVDTFFGNLAKGYMENGVTYGFVATWLDTGIDKPKNYSEDEILGIFKDGELENMEKLMEEDSKKDTPNIIMVQLESFIDPDLVNSIDCSKETVPYFKSLLKEYSSGYFTVPSVGAGTANIEFEVMTGISAKFFGPGEYPYKAVLSEKTMEAVPYNLKDMGYATHAIHNHRGVFYNRNVVFPNIGFDDFTSMEYMNDVEKTPKNWARDGVLIKYIMDCLNKTEEKDYIYTISVEGHGKYPTEQVIENPEIEVTKASSEEKKWQYEYYVNMAHSMDAFIKDLTDTLSEYDEDVVLVLYGDHLPALDMTAEEMNTGSLYKTQYVIWSNYGMEKKDKDVAAYQMSAYLFERLGIHGGTVTTYHQNHEKDKDYLKNLEAIGYDMLYGKQHVYRGKEWKPTDMKMGIDTIRIDSIIKIGKKYYIKGENFTQFSYVTLNEKKLDTTYLSPTLLALEEEVDPDRAEDLKVSQIEKYDTILSTTE